MYPPSTILFCFENVLSFIYLYIHIHERVFPSTHTHIHTDRTHRVTRHTNQMSITNKKEGKKMGKSDRSTQRKGIRCTKKKEEKKCEREQKGLRWPDMGLSPSHHKHQSSLSTFHSFAFCSRTQTKRATEWKRQTKIIIHN